MKWQLDGLLSFPAYDKKDDKRYKWFVGQYGDECWELDAMDPNDLRTVIEEAVDDAIGDREASERASKCQEAEQQSLPDFLDGWGRK